MAKRIRGRLSDSERRKLCQLELFDDFLQTLRDVEVDPKVKGLCLGWAWEALAEFATSLGPEFTKARRGYYQTADEVDAAVLLAPQLPH